MSKDFSSLEGMARATKEAMQNINWNRVAEHDRRSNSEIQREQLKDSSREDILSTIRKAAEKASIEAEINKVADAMKKRVIDKFYANEYTDHSDIAKKPQAKQNMNLEPKEEKSSKPKTPLNGIVEW
ncbi:hypothetical protein J1C14_003354 [Acinetobacter baumannii]|nr:hypothetical protein [Acinetobacter baumannii]MDC5104552.1 hypothetical protein [Acinetobacter baumannii]